MKQLEVNLGKVFRSLAVRSWMQAELRTLPWIISTKNKSEEEFLSGTAIHAQ